jgi:hypothetical protein
MKKEDLQNRNGLHWNDDDLLDRLYALSEPAGKDASHLDSCVECGARWQALTARRASVAAGDGPAAGAMDEQMLRRQREKIWQRVGEASRPWFWRAVPAAATALMLMVGVALNTSPAPEALEQKMAMSQQATPAVSDDQFFSEIASVANSEEPSSAAAMRNLFDGGVEGERQ